MGNGEATDKSRDERRSSSLERKSLTKAQKTGFRPLEEGKPAQPTKALEQSTEGIHHASDKLGHKRAGSAPPEITITRVNTDKNLSQYGERLTVAKPEVVSEQYPWATSSQSGEEMSIQGFKQESPVDTTLPISKKRGRSDPSSPKDVSSKDVSRSSSQASSRNAFL